MPFKLESFGISNIGLVRSNNEDVWAVVNENQFFILADGMGGHKAGEVAASYAVESMCKAIRPLTQQSSVEEACQLLRSAIAQANTRVFNASHLHADYSGMGTTLSCFVIAGHCLIYAHVGDSRLYRYRNQLEQLTEDHKNKGAKPSQRNVITRAIGNLSTILPDIGVIPLKSKDLYLLCSDGLSDYVEEETIAHLLSSPLSLKEIGEKLIEAALKKGGNDNITLLLARVCAEDER